MYHLTPADSVNSVELETQLQVERHVLSSRKHGNYNMAVFIAPSAVRCGHDQRDSSPIADRADRSSCGVTAAAAALAHCVSLAFI